MHRPLATPCLFAACLFAALVAAAPAAHAADLYVVVDTTT